MTRRQRLERNEAAGREHSAKSRASNTRAKTLNSQARSGRRKNLNQEAESGKKKPFSLQNLKIADLYRPLKKPVTLRLDADVLAWFKKDGSRYQTRINNALRKFMERELKDK